MSRLKDSERTKLIAEFIRTGKSPEGYEITVNESSKYKVRRIKSKLESLLDKQERLRKQLDTIEKEIDTLRKQPNDESNDKQSAESSDKQDDESSDA